MSDAHHYTVIGANGFIGRHLVQSLKAEGQTVRGYGRDWSSDDSDSDLGHVLFCAGLTGARANGSPAEALESHAGLLADVLRSERYQSLLYLSSTRLYLHALETNEDLPILCNPNDPNDLFNATKLAAESTCLAAANPAVKVVRLSNVFGKTSGTDTFLTSVIHEGLTTGKILSRSKPDSAKDYIDIRTVVNLLPRILHLGKHRLYNVATGYNTEQGVILEAISQLIGCPIEVAVDATTVSFPIIDTHRLRSEFPLTGNGLLTRLPEIVSAYRNDLNSR